MPFAELLRSTVFLTAGGATALAAITVIGAQRDFNPTLLIISAAWWIVAAWIGMSLGQADRTADSMREVLAGAKSVHKDGATPSLGEPGRIAWTRMWPILAAVATAGGIGIVFPEVSAIGCGYALLVALAWRNRESAVLAIEGRDGVRFLVESGSPFKAVKLIRTPGFRAF
ncbi:MAG TPA: hypothetical protein VMF31_10215 [Solirubrobacterales bacterium]|nr:hypothetical protein [Solirubrobacterales bacterium]